MSSYYKINLTAIILILLGMTLIIVTGINKPVFIFINTRAAYLSPFFWSNITFLGDSLPAATLMLLFIRKKPDIIWAGIAATIFATIISNLLKYYTGILRPPAVLDSSLINIIGPALTSRSFPSGHTVTIFTLAGVLMSYYRSFIERAGLILLSVLVGISRIAVGVHWPADVLAGAALGLACGTTGIYLVSRAGWKESRVIQIVTGLILIFATLYLLLYYDCKYSMAIHLQYLFALTVLIAGTWQYCLLIRNGKKAAIKTG